MICCVACRGPLADLVTSCAACGWAGRDEGSYLDLAPASVEGALPDDAFDRLAAAEEHSFWFRSRNRLLLWALDTHFPKAESFLEVGCGNAYVLAGIASGRPGMRLAGSDLSTAGLQRAGDRLPEALLLRADACALPFEEEFDVVGAFDVAEHVPDDRRAFAAMRTAVKVGGGVILTVPQHRWLWSAADRYSGHQRRYARQGLVRTLEAAGLRLRRLTSFVTLLLPLMAASRLWQTAARRPFDPSREFAVANRVDQLLGHVMDAERAMITRGARLPVGGSLLAVAERIA